MWPHKSKRVWLPPVLHQGLHFRAGWWEQRQLDHVTMLAEERVQLVQGYGRARLQIQEATAVVSMQQACLRGAAAERASKLR